MFFYYVRLFGISCALSVWLFTIPAEANDAPQPSAHHCAQNFGNEVLLSDAIIRKKIGNGLMYFMDDRMRTTLFEYLRSHYTRQSQMTIPVLDGSPFTLQIARLVPPKWAKAVASFSRNWLGLLEQNSSEIPRVGLKDAPLHLLDVAENGGTPVYRVKIDSQHKYFRPFRLKKRDDSILRVQMISVARYQLAAERLSQIFNLKIVPRSKIVKVNDLLGVLSDEAPGHPLPRKSKVDFFGLLDPSSRILLEFFEFLVGNRDARRGNIHIDASGHPQVFDYGQAWTVGIPYPSPSLLGSHLPEGVPADLIAILRNQSQEKWRDLFSDLLAPVEIEGFLLRRGLILIDAERIRAAAPDHEQKWSIEPISASAN